MKKATLLLGLCFPMTILAVTTAGDNTLKVDRNVKPLTPIESAFEKATRHDHAMPLSHQFVNSLEQRQQQVGFLSLLKPARLYRAENSVKEQCDSIVRTDPFGTVSAVQYMTYDEANRPSHWTTYVIDSATGERTLAGDTGFEYLEDEGPVLTERWNLYYNYGSLTGEKQEYIYGDDNFHYTNQIIYNYKGGQWLPYVKSDYEYDEQGRTISQTQYMYYDYLEDWKVMKREEQTFDEQGRQTCYYPYQQNEETGEWEGYGYGYYGEEDGVEYEFDERGNVAKAHYKLWNGEGWMDYKLIEQTFDEQGRMTVQDTKYWNKAKGDWSGSEEYRGSVESNSRFEVTYDEQGRDVLRTNSSLGDDGEYHMGWKGVKEFTWLTEDSLQVVELDYYRVSEDQLDVTQRHTYTYNAYGSECYFLSEMLLGELGMIKLQEQYREMDKYNHYLDGEYYRFNYFPNTRWAEIKERARYAPDMKMELNKQTWNQMWTWTGDGMQMSEDWYPARYQTWEWACDTIDVKYRSYSWDGETEQLNSGYDVVYDFDTPYEDLNIFYDSQRREMFYKPLYEISYGGSEDNYYKFTYYFSKIEATGIKPCTAPNAQEVARYNVAGQRTDGRAKGLSIVRYSDGTSRKVMTR